jgi:hypothetical protein
MRPSKASILLFLATFAAIGCGVTFGPGDYGGGDVADGGSTVDAGADDALALDGTLAVDSANPLGKPLVVSEERH